MSGIDQKKIYYLKPFRRYDGGTTPMQLPKPVMPQRVPRPSPRVSIMDAPRGDHARDAVERGIAEQEQAELFGDSYED